MGIASITTDVAGQIGVTPRIVRITTTDSLATVLSENYLASSQQEGFTFYQNDYFVISYGTPPTVITCTCVIETSTITLFNTAPISTTTAVWGGGGASNAFVATGLTSSSVVVASILSSTNTVAIAKVVPTTDTLTITFTADPGAGTAVNYIAY